MPPFSDHNLELGEDAVNHVIDLLKKYGYPILRNDLSWEFSRSKLTPEQAAELHKFRGLRFDIWIGRKGKDTPYLAEIKGKELDRFKKWVDKDLYDGYYEISNLPFPLLYFVWIRENNKIYRHEITNPEKFNTIDYGGTQVYLIPTELIHEVELSDDIFLAGCKLAEYTERDFTQPLKHAHEKTKGKAT
jgi:hypothetical protein